MATQLVEQPQGGAVAAAPQDMSAGILAVIARAATDPNVDIDKMERLLEMQERVAARHAEIAFNDALSAMQPKLPVITERGGIKDRNGNIQSKYALWEDVNEAIRPVLAEHGFALSFRTRTAEGKVIVTGILRHRDGHSDVTEMELPADTSGSKNVVQAIGSSVSYGKRYTAFALLNITSGGEDDDGAAGGGKYIDDVQLARLQTLADNVGADLGKFCTYMKVRSLSELPASKYDAAVASLNAKGANKSGAAK